MHELLSSEVLPVETSFELAENSATGISIERLHESNICLQLHTLAVDGHQMDDDSHSEAFRMVNEVLSDLYILVPLEHAKSCIYVSNNVYTNRTNMNSGTQPYFY